VDRKGSRRKELRRWAHENARELMRVAREDRIAAPQMKRLERLQAGLLESWDLLPEGYRPLLDEDSFTIVGEVEGATRLARRRAALRRLLESVDQREISRRIVGLEKDFSEPEKSSPLWASFESTLDNSPSPSSLEPGLTELKSRVALFRQSTDEVRRSVESLPAATPTERLPIG
jgi:hypothetical protein